MYTALYHYAVSVAECVGGLCIAAGCSAQMSVRVLASVFYLGSNVLPYILPQSNYYTMNSYVGPHERLLYVSFTR